MADPIASISRAAAARIALTAGTRIQADVELALFARGKAPRREKYIDPVELGSLVVSAAGLAWQVYSARRQKSAEKQDIHPEGDIRNEIASRITAFHPPTSENIIEIIVSETITFGEESYSRNGGDPSDPDQ